MEVENYNKIEAHHIENHTYYFLYGAINDLPLFITLATPMGQLLWTTMKNVRSNKLMVRKQFYDFKIPQQHIQVYTSGLLERSTVKTILDTIFWLCDYLKFSCFSLLWYQLMVLLNTRTHRCQSRVLPWVCTIDTVIHYTIAANIIAWQLVPVTFPGTLRSKLCGRHNSSFLQGAWVGHLRVLLKEVKKGRGHEVSPWCGVVLN